MAGPRRAVEASPEERSEPQGRASISDADSDIDADGDLDLFLANSGPNRYWVNESGTFEDAISQFSPADDGPSFGAAVGDFDNDGDIDLYVPYFGEANRLYRRTMI